MKQKALKVTQHRLLVVTGASTNHYHPLLGFLADYSRFGFVDDHRAPLEAFDLGVYSLAVNQSCAVGGAVPRWQASLAPSVRQQSVPIVQ